MSSRGMRGDRTFLGLNYAVGLSRNGTEIKNLAQKVAILPAQIDELHSSRT